MYGIPARFTDSAGRAWKDPMKHTTRLPMPTTRSPIDLEHINQIDALLDLPDAPVASILLPTHRTGREVQQGAIHLRNALSAITAKLQALGIEAGTQESMLAPAHRFASDSSFWAHQGEGLALFITPDTTTPYRLPFDVGAQANVGRHAWIRPLVAHLTPDLEYHVLVLDREQSTLYRGSRYRLHEIALDDLVGFSEFARYDEYEPQINLHSSGTRTGPQGRQPAIVHGKGSPDREVIKRKLAHYMQHVAERVRAAMPSFADAPFLLAGPPDLRGLYTQASAGYTDPAGQLDGSADKWAPDDLRAACWSICEPLAHAEQQRCVERFEHLTDRHPEQTATITEDVVSLAFFGRVDTLLVASEMDLWGSFDSALALVDIHEPPRPDSADLFNLAIVLTLQHGGTVHSCTPDSFTEPIDIAAILRY